MQIPMADDIAIWRPTVIDQEPGGFDEIGATGARRFVPQVAQHAGHCVRDAGEPSEFIAHRLWIDGVQLRHRRREHKGELARREHA